MQQFARQTFAPEGRRVVATGGASPAAKRAKRNPWTHSHLNHPAPEGRRELPGANRMPRSIFKRAPRAAHLSTHRARPSPRRGEKRMMNRFSTGSASGRSAAATLHPWLQPVAPPGRERVADRATSSGQGNDQVGQVVDLPSLCHCLTLDIPPTRRRMAKAGQRPALLAPAEVEFPASGTPADTVTDPQRTHAVLQP